MSVALSAPVMTTTPAPTGASDAVTQTIAGTTVVGWQTVQITRGLNAIPASFDIGLTEKYPTTPDVWVRPGDPCTVKIGNDLVITGYVDRYTASIDPGNHTVRVQGRSKSEDLIDCSAFFGDPNAPSIQRANLTALAAIQALAAPYGVTVDSIAGEGPLIPQVVINLGETAWEIIDRLIRYSQFVAYDMPDGSVRLAQVSGGQVLQGAAEGPSGSTQSMASGFVQGENIEAANVTYSMDGRFSQYEGHFMSSMVYGTDTGVNTPGVGKIVTDTGVPRFRKRYVISEQTQMGESLAYARAVWERNYRFGQSLAVQITCDSWRDSVGTLWEPNSLAPISLPVLKTPTDQQWVIGTVTYRRDDNGQHADILLMPPDAYDPEPVALQPLPPTVQQVEQFNATKPT